MRARQPRRPCQSAGLRLARVDHQPRARAGRVSNLLTISRMRAWRTCKRLHKLSYMDGWRPVRQADALRQGDMGHLGLEAWWRAEHGVRLDAALAAMTGRAGDPYEQVAMEELLRGYDYEYADQMDRYEVFVIEGSFTAPLVNPETGQPSRTWLLAGKKDGVIRDLSTGAVLLLEHKLTADSFAEDSDPYWIKLGMDAQVSHYFMGAETDGYAPEGCLYDVLRRPQLRPLKATPEESRKYTKFGELYKNQREHDETLKEYRVRVRADISDRPTKYFGRRMIARTERDLVEYLTDTWAEARIMREAEKADVAPKSPEACHRFGTCTYWPICAYGLDPADHPEMFERVEDVHPELELLQEAAA